jgi:kynurenine 3-monooxygenase
MALKDVGLDKTVLDLAIPMKGRMIHSPDGRKTTPIPYGDFGEVINSVSRRGLNEVLVNAAERFSNITLHFGEELQSISATNELTFKNAQSGKIKSEKADFVLGCDGAYSVVRREMMKFTR